MNNYYVYIIRCTDGSYYTGMTNDIDRRWFAHTEGLITECCTFKRRPLALVFVEHTHDVMTAIEREKQIKRWSRAKKEALIRNDETGLIQLATAYWKREKDDALASDDGVMVSSSDVMVSPPNHDEKPSSNCSARRSSPFGQTQGDKPFSA